MTTIYALVDPISKEVRYVGQSYDAKFRYKQHLAYPCNKNLESWISQLKTTHLKPELLILEECDSNIAIEREFYWIGQYNNLLNIITSPNLEQGDFTKVQIRLTTKKRLDVLQKRLGEILSLGKISQTTLMIWLVDLGEKELDKLETPKETH